MLTQVHTSQSSQPAWRSTRLLLLLAATALLAVVQSARADTAADAVSLALAQTQRHDTPEAEAAAPRFLFTLETSATLADPLPLSSNEAALLIAAGDDTPPALVPLAPPVWAGLALLGGMALVRSRRRRRYRIAS